MASSSSSGSTSGKPKEEGADPTRAIASHAKRIGALEDKVSNLVTTLSGALNLNLTGELEPGVAEPEPVEHTE